MKMQSMLKSLENIDKELEAISANLQKIAMMLAVILKNQ